MHDLRRMSEGSPHGIGSESPATWRRRSFPTWPVLERTSDDVRDRAAALDDDVRDAHAVAVGGVLLGAEQTERTRDALEEPELLVGSLAQPGVVLGLPVGVAPEHVP